MVVVVYTVDKWHLPYVNQCNMIQIRYIGILITHIKTTAMKVITSSGLVVSLEDYLEIDNK
jgi:hypothetical protein